MEKVSNTIRVNLTACVPIDRYLISSEVNNPKFFGLTELDILRRWLSPHGLCEARVEHPASVQRSSTSKIASQSRHSKDSFDSPDLNQNIPYVVPTNRLFVSVLLVPFFF